MAGRIHGISVTLYSRQKTGEDGFGRPIYEEVPETVENVLVGEPSSEEAVDTLNLTGKHLEYVLGIPKGDSHTWTDRKIRFFKQDFRAIGAPAQGIEDMIPLEWNKKVKVERYE